MKAAPKTHARRVGTAKSPVCGTPGRDMALTDEPDKVTCDRCRMLLGLGLTWAQEHARTLPKRPGPRAVNSLLERAFVGNEARLDELCTRGRKAIADWDVCSEFEAHIAGDNMADVIRGFISALGRAD